MIYLDSAATTRVSAAVCDAMTPYLIEQYANPGTLYSFGREAKEVVQNARQSVSRLFGCEPEQVVFTSGGSEANSMVFRGIVDHLKGIGKKHVLVSAVEHDSVIKAASSLIKDGFDVQFVPVTSEGVVSVSVLDGMITDDTGLVSVMYVNNETGAVNLVEDIGALCIKRGVLFHTDCVQAAGANKIDVVRIGCDFATVSAHKIHGVKGAGALYVKDKSKLNSLIYGGEAQEFGLRGGTENVPGIVAMGKACEVCCDNIVEDIIAVSTMKQRFYMEFFDGMKEHCIEDTIHINGASPITPGKILNLRIDGVDAETLLLMLDTKGVCVSAGSACRSREIEPSHVLTAMGLSKSEARSSIRVSFSKMNRIDEVVDAARIFANCVCALRGHTEG